MPVVGIGDPMNPSTPPYCIGELGLPGHRHAMNLEFEYWKNQNIWYLKSFKPAFVTVTNMVNFWKPSQPVKWD